MTSLFLLRFQKQCSYDFYSDYLFYYGFNNDNNENFCYIHNNENFSCSLRKLEDGKNVIYHTSMVWISLTLLLFLVGLYIIQG